MIFEKLEVTVDLSYVGDCHWLPINGNKSVLSNFPNARMLIEFEREKMVRRMNLLSLEIKTPEYISDSLCRCYKVLRWKREKLWSSKFVHAFWVSNGSIKLKMADNDRVHIIIHSNDVEELFPGDELLLD